MVFSAMALNPLDDGGDTHAAADAQRDQRAVRVAALQLVDHGSGDHGAGGTQRVSHRDGAAVDVELLVRDVQVLLELQHDGGEGLVQLEQVDVVDRQARSVQHFLGGRGRAGEHDDRVGAAGGGGHDARPRGQALRLAGGFGADQHEGGAVDDAGAVTTGVDVVDLLDGVVLGQRHGDKAAHLADAVERGLQLRQAFEIGVGPHVLVVVEDRQAVLVDDRHHRFREVAAGPRRGRLLLRAQRVAVDVFTGEALDGGDQVGADALRDEADLVVGLRVGRPGAAVGTHRDATHRLDATGEHQVIPAGAHLLRGGVDGFQAGGAEPVELHATRGLGQAGGQHRGAGDVATLVTDGRYHAQDHVADQGLVQVGEAAAQFVDQTDDQVQRLDLVQRAFALLAARRTDCLVDEGFFGHD